MERTQKTNKREMSRKIFNMVGRKVGGGKLVLIAMVDDNFLGDVPDDFQVIAEKVQGTDIIKPLPTIEIHTETLKDKTEQFMYDPIDILLFRNIWFCQEI